MPNLNVVDIVVNIISCALFISHVARVTSAAAAAAAAASPLHQQQHRRFVGV